MIVYICDMQMTLMQERVAMVEERLSKYGQKDPVSRLREEWKEKLLLIQCNTLNEREYWFSIRFELFNNVKQALKHSATLNSSFNVNSVNLVITSSIDSMCLCADLFMTKANRYIFQLHDGTRAADPLLYGRWKLISLYKREGKKIVNYSLLFIYTPDLFRAGRKKREKPLK